MDEIGGIVASAQSRRWRMLVGGELVDAADGATYESIDPSSEQLIAVVPAASSIRMANATPYGLTAAVWTNDVRRAHRVARELEAGYVWINSVAAHYLGTPFGGVKDSGTGREEGLEELLSFTQTKTVSLPLG